MPTIKIPVIRFRELHMGATEKDFLHHFGPALIARGFRLVPGRWVKEPMGGAMVLSPKVDAEGTDLIADPPLVYDRQSDPLTLIVSQNIPGRIHDRDARLTGLLNYLKAGRQEAIAQLHGFLLSEGDDRAATLKQLSVDVPEDALMTPDSGESRGRKMESPGDDLVSSLVLAEKLLCKKVLLLFGAVEEPL